MAHAFDEVFLRVLRLHLLHAHWKSLVLAKRGRNIPRTAGSQGTQGFSIAQRLPHEIILLIFGHLVDLRRASQSSCCTNPELQFKGGSFAIRTAEETARSQQHLLWAALACKLWYAVGVELLYAAPFLSTLHKVDLFRRTLIDNPSELRHFVKDVYLPVTAQSRTSDALCWLWGQRNSKGELDEVSTLLAQLGSSLHGLTLRHVVKPDLVSVAPLDKLLHNPSFADTLEHLTVYGSTFEARYHPQFSLIPTLSSPITGQASHLAGLRSLCLRGLYILPTSSLPLLPRLHSLQLVQNYHFSSDNVDAAFRLLRREALPALRTLEIFAEHFAKSSSHTQHQGHLCMKSLADPAILSTLETFTFLQAPDKEGEPHHRCLSVTRAIPPDTSIRHLTLGILGAKDHTDLACWKLPSCLESVTFLISGSRHGLVGNSREHSDTSPPEDIYNASDAIRRCIKDNSPSDVPRLRELTIVYTDGTERMSGLGYPSRRGSLPLQEHRKFEGLEQLCTERELVLRAMHIDVDAWITERLAIANRI